MKPDTDVVQIKHAVGEAISEWVAVEMILGELLAVVVNGDHAATLAAFHAVDTSETKLRMVDAAIRQGVEDDDLLARWIELNQTAERLLARRDHFVRWTVVWDGGRPLLRAQPGAFKAGFGAEFGGYAADDIRQVRVEMAELMRAVSALVQQLEP